MRKKIFTILMFMMIALFSFNAVYAETTVVVAQNADAKSMDPTTSNDVPSHRVYLNIYDTLIERDTNMKLVPALAESWEQVDPLTLVLHLRKDVKFHNGDPLKASDVVFSLTRAKEAPSLMSFFYDVDKIEAVDDNTVKITTKKPFGPLTNYLAHKGAAILNEKAVKAAGNDYGQQPVGTGPFIFDSWRSGDRVTLKANPNYFKGKPAIDTLVFRVIPEGVNRTISLETKEADIAYDIDPVDLRMVKEHSDLNLIQEPAMNINYLGFNTKKAPFDNKLVRQAIAYAVDRQSIIDAVYLGAANEANSPVSPSVFGYSKDAKKYSFDVAKAKELLAQAGYPNGFKTKIWLNDNTVRRDIAVILQDQLKQIGIDLQIEILEWGSYLDRLARGEHDMFLLGWTSSPDSDSALYALFHSKNHGSSGNRTYFTNSRMDQLLDLGRESTVPEDRIKYYKEAQDIVQEEVPMLVLVYPYDNVGLQKTIKGFILDAESEHRLIHVSK